LRIGFDIQALQTGSKHGGVGRYSYNLLNEFIKSYPGNQYLLFANGLYAEREYPFASRTNASYKIIDYLPGNDRNPLNRGIQLIDYRSAKLQLLHILSPIEFRDTAVVSRRALPGKTVVTLYDIIPLVLQDLYLTTETMRNDYFDRLKTVTAADLILTISESSRQDAINILRIPDKKIVTIGCAISSDFHRVENLDPSLVEATKQKYGITGKFIFNLGSIDVRKNQKRLIEAFADLPNDLLDKYTLVIACNYSLDATHDFRVFAQNRLKNKVLFLHFCPDVDVNTLYNCCDLFVLPSLYEGFGLPVLEAMSCGAPVIASNNSSIPEITGRTDNLFDPMNSVSITKLMVEVLGNNNYREELRAYGMRRAQEFSWKAVAMRAKEAYDYLVDQRRKKRPITSKIRLGIITTWNTKCGIANYCRYLLNHVGEAVSTKIFANQDCIRNGLDEDFVSRCWERGWIDGDLGKLGDKITAQDAQVVNIQYNFGFFGVKQLGDLIIDLARRGIRVIVSFHSTAPVEVHGVRQSLESIAVELRCADRLLVHSPTDVALLKTIGLEKNVSVFPHGMLVFEDEDICAVRKAQNIPNSKVVGSFGFLLPHKGVLELIQSVPYLRAEYPDILVLLVCALYPDPVSGEYYERCKSRVEELGLENHVCFVTEYLEERAIIRRLHVADLLVLPYKSTTESSSAAIRLAACAKRPIITSALPIFDDFRNETYQIRSVEPTTIANAIKVLYKSRDTYEKLKSAIIDKGKRETWERVAEVYRDIVYKVYETRGQSAELRCLRLIDDISDELTAAGIDETWDQLSVLANEIFKAYSLDIA
jgi:glycosyltransferase involved in cell wall biosynthesis